RRRLDRGIAPRYRRRSGDGLGAAARLVRADADLRADPRRAARAHRRRCHALRPRPDPGHLVPSPGTDGLVFPDAALDRYTMTAGTILLEVHGLSRRFGGVLAVGNLDLTVAAGEIVGLIGPNGAGKTTAFNLIAGFHAPTAGSIRFKGDSVVGLKPHAICRLGLARTFQIVQPFTGLSALDNVTIVALHRARNLVAAPAPAAQV